MHTSGLYPEEVNRTYVRTVGSALSINCNVQTADTSNVTVFWRRVDGRHTLDQLQLMHDSCLTCSTGFESRLVSSQLIGEGYAELDVDAVDGLQEDDAGAYECVAQGPSGNDSVTVNLVVLGT